MPWRRSSRHHGAMTEDQRPGAVDDAAAAAAPTQPLGLESSEPALRLERSRRHKMVAGVCGGLGRQFDVDPVIFRVTLAVLSVVGGLGLLFYAFAWLIVPLEGEEDNEGRRLLSGRVEGSSLAALMLALVGCGLFLASIGSGGDSMTFSVLLAVSVGAAAYWSRYRRQAEAEESPEPLPDAPPEAQAPPVPYSPSWWRGPLTKESGTGYLWGPADGPYDDSYEPEPGGCRNVPRRPAGAEVQRRGRSIGGLVFLGALCAAVVGTAAAWSAQPLSTALVIGLSCALAAFGLGLVISAFAGRIGGGTIFAVGLTGVLLAGAVALPDYISTTWTEITWSPATAAEVHKGYELDTGAAVLDLTGLELGDDDTVRTAVTVGLGDLRVIVPENVTVDARIKADLGGYRLPGEVNAGGIGLSERKAVAPRGGDEPKGAVDLELEVGMGEIIIEQAGQQTVQKGATQ
jgi:phage shock protein PspC (stress-responsive transcriptional regulator)